MPAVPPLDAVAALIGIDLDDPADAADAAVLRELLARRVARCEAQREPDGTPGLQVVRADG